MDFGIELLRRATSWPVITFFLLAYVFRSQTSDFIVELRTHISRMRKAGLTGVEFDAAEKRQENAENPTTSTLRLCHKITALTFY